jgi:RNA polymerase-binding protein
MSVKRRPAKRDRLPLRADNLRDKLAARQLVPYECTRGHRFSVPFFEGIDVPRDWDCRCGKPAVPRSLT